MAAGDVGVSITTIKGFPCNVFDGVDDYVEIPHNDNQLGANLSNGFTISAWINPRSAGEGLATGSGHILSKGTGDTGFFFQNRQDNGKYNFYLKGANKLTETTARTLGVWTHYLITISGATPARGNIYKNGVLGSTADVDMGGAVSALITSTANIFIGNINGGTSTHDGSIRSVKMWNRVLSTTEITEDANGKHNSHGCIHFFKLGGDYADYGSVGVTATNSGSLSQVVEGDTTSTAIKALRTLTGISGVYMITRGEGGQVVSTGIQNT